MVIDIHTFPGFFEEISQDPKRVAFRREQYFLYKQHVWPLSLFMTQMDAAGIDKSVISAEDVVAHAVAHKLGIMTEIAYRRRDPARRKLRELHPAELR